MRLSLRKGAHAALSSAAWQEIRVRSVENVCHSKTTAMVVVMDGLKAVPFN
jgi:hypothetical protein